MGGGLGRVTNHPVYYLSDGSVSFLTGNTLFRVHRSFFERESEFFRELFATAAEDDPLSGSDARPFTLNDVTAGEFENLLWVWYDRDYSYREQTKEHWVAILRLSTRWAFPKITALAVRELEALHLPPAEMISIYNHYGIDDERLLDSYVELCRSPTLPTEADGNLMQMETLINILQAREDAQRKAVELGHESPTSASLEDGTLREILSKFFKKGLNPRSNGTSTGSEVQASNLNGERAHRTGANATITIGEPQVPDRKAQYTSGLASHVNDSLQTGSEGKEGREKEQDKEREEKEKQEKARQAKEWEEKAKAEKAKQDKEREEKAKEEKVRQAKEREEKAKAEKAKKDKEKEEKEKEKARQAKEKEEREKAQKAEEQKSLGNNRHDPYRRW